MRIRFFNKFIPLTLAAAAISCVNEEYDITKVKIDQISGLEGISMPIGSSKAIMLDNLIDLNGGTNYLKTDNDGNYYVGIADPDLITETYQIPEFSFAGYDDDNPHDFTIGEAIQIPKLDSDFETPVIPFTEVVYDIAIDQKDIPEMMSGIVYADVNSDLIVGFKYDKSALPFNAVTIAAETRIEFPEWVVLGELDKAFNRLSDHELELKEDMRIAPSGSFIDFPLDALDFTKMPEGQGIIGKGHLYLDAKVRLNGGIILKASDCTSAGTYKPIITTYLHIDPMTIDSVQLTSIDLGENAVQTHNVSLVNDLPSVLYGDNINLDFNSLILNLKYWHNLPVSGKVNLSLDDIDLNMDFREYCKDNAENSSDFITEEYQYIDNGDLLNNMPENLVINTSITVDEISEVTDRCECWGVVAPGDSYQLGCGYEVIVPLTFGKDFRITLDEQIKDLNVEVSGVDVAEAHIEFNLVNTLPLDFSLTAQAIDANGNVLPHISVELEGNVLGGRTDAPAVNPVYVKLTNTGELKFDGLNIKMVASAASDESTLNKNQYIQLTDIALSLPQGLTYNFEE